MESILYESVCLTVDAVIFGICYKFYRNSFQDKKAVSEAPRYDIDGELYKKVKENGNSVPYAVVAGMVKATSTSLKSQYATNVKGVIREKITKERRVRWSPTLRIWSSEEHNISHILDHVPFALIGKNMWFKSQVEVLNPQAAQELILSTIHDDFSSHEDTFGEAVVGYFRGERTTGIREIEKILPEGVLLMGIGELTLEDNKLKLLPPKSGKTYFLTSLSYESLCDKLQQEASFFKILLMLFGCVGIFCVTSILVKYYRIRRAKLAAEALRERHRQEVTLRRLADPTRNINPDDEHVPRCVICLTKPIEVLILECGHACVCLECSESLNNSCPVCRSYITRKVPAYLP